MNRTNWIVGVVAVVVIIVLAVLWSQGRLSSHKTYQAVFLTNGQVYFGKVYGENGKTVIVKDIFYLRVQQPVQPSDQSKTDQQNSQVQLIKLGNELHGPKDEMRINRDQILFIEDMKDDGQVVTAINKFKANGGVSTTPLGSPSPSASK